MTRTVWSLLVAALVFGCSRSNETGNPQAGDSEAKTSSGSEAEESGAAPAGSETKTSSRAVPTPPPPETFTPFRREGDPARLENMTRAASGVEYAVIREGEGERPARGSRVKLYITGWIVTGDRLGPKFWDSRDDRAAHEYVLDDAAVEGGLITGLVEVLLDMKRGERRWVIVPSELAYGNQGYPPLVPAGVDLAFDVELVSFEPAG